MKKTVKKTVWIVNFDGEKDEICWEKVKALTPLDAILITMAQMGLSPTDIFAVYVAQDISDET